MPATAGGITSGSSRSVVSAPFARIAGSVRT